MRDSPQVDRPGHLAHDHAVRQARLGPEHGNGSDHHRLRVFGRKAGCAQPLREVSRAIVPVQLPLDGLAALGEDPHLPGDQLVELVTVEAVEVAILDHPAIPEADRAQQRAVALDTNTVRKPVMHVRAQLCVIGVEQGNDVLIAHSGEPSSERSCR